MTHRYFPTVLSVLLSICIALSALLLPFAVIVQRGTAWEEAYIAVGQDQRVLQAQWERIDQVLTSFAETQPIKKETLAAFVTPEALALHNQQVGAWVYDLVQGKMESPAPLWPIEELTEAIRTDETFAAAIPATQRKTEARNLIAYPIAQQIQRIVIPVRVSLLQLALPTLMKNDKVQMVLSVAPALAFGVGAVMTLLTVVTMLLYWRKRDTVLHTVASGLLSGGLTALVLSSLVMIFRPVENLFQSSSPLLALNVHVFVQNLLLAGMVVASGCVILGGLLAALRRLHRHEA